MAGLEESICDLLMREPGSIAAHRLVLFLRATSFIGGFRLDLRREWLAPLNTAASSLCRNIDQLGLVEK
jgi:hypothetical protein